MDTERQSPPRPRGRPKETNKVIPLSVTVRPADMAALDMYCDRHDVGRSEATRRAIRQLVDTDTATTAPAPR